MTLPRRGFTLAEIVAHLGGRVMGDGSRVVNQVATLEAAGPDQLSFLANRKYAHLLASTRAGAVIIDAHSAEGYAADAIVAPAPYEYFARVAQLFNPPQLPAPGVHPSAVVDSPVPASVSIGPQVVIGRNVVLGEGVAIEAGSVVGEGVVIGAGSRIYPRVTLYPACQIGERVVIHSGVVIGADGFGYARLKDASWFKIPQIGRVVVGNDVEIGANTTIDRGALDDTVIGNGVILDNQIQIGHNVRIGDHTAIAGCVGIAGSTHIGERCMIGGAAMIIGHLEIADDVTVSSCTMVTKSIRNKGVVTGTVPQQSHDEWLKNFSRLRHLSHMADQLRALEQRVDEMKAQS